MVDLVKANRIRKRWNYPRWKALAEFLETEPTVEEVLERMFQLLAEHGVLGTREQKAYEQESLDLVKQEMGNRSEIKRLALSFLTAYLVANFEELGQDDAFEDYWKGKGLDRDTSNLIWEELKLIADRYKGD